MDLFEEMGFDKEVSRWDAERDDDWFDPDEDEHPDEFEQLANQLLGDDEDDLPPLEFE